MTLIFLGGGIGSILRYSISKYLNSEWAYGTFTANLIGCFLIGILMGMYHKGNLSQELIFLLAVGFCGGLTTFSTFAFELMELLKSEAWKPFLWYSGGSMVLGLGLSFIGWQITS